MTVASAIGAEAEFLLSASNPVSARLGAYRVIRELGRGGMGSVYLATRDDDQYQKQVAIKVIRHGMDTADVLDRFRHERQILANLDHPYIARLVDGGTAPDGRPFFVMDYVEGRPVDVYCRETGLDVKARCLLFLSICEAVAHAHRNLVVHRDLKPSNILITETGTPRLLDFGVAKLLNAGRESALTADTAARPITPEYASPEQVRGLAINTATDVYSLGAILYELLTGSRAQPITDLTPLAIERAVCDTDAARPSLLVRGLDADLDNIVAMAMRKEPERRYASVDRLADDLRRHLDGRPVVARHDSFGYRTRKFLRRNRLPIGVAALFAAVLVGGAATATLQARRATREQIRAEGERQRAIESEARAAASRQFAETEAREADRQRLNAVAQGKLAEMQRIAAETERQIAERRFQQVRQLAGKFLLEFHDSIATLPGSTAARKMVVSTGLQYYDTLIQEAGGNRDLLEEIARGYDRLGDVQGNLYYANLGDTAGALASYEKARAIRKSITDPAPQFLLDRIGGEVKRAQVLGLTGDIRHADATLRDAIALGEHDAAFASYPVQESLANAYRAHGDLYFRTGDYAKSVEPYQKLLEIWTELAKQHLKPAAEQTGISLANAKLADAYVRLRRPQEALKALRIAVPIDHQLVDADHSNLTRLRKLYVDYTLLCLVFRANDGMAGPGEGRATAETAAELANRMMSADPNNSTAIFDVMTAETLVGDWLREHDDAPGAVVRYRKAVDIAEKFASTGAPAFFTWESLIYAHQRLASGLSKAGELEEALEHCRKAEEYAGRADKMNPGLLEIVSRRADIADNRAQAYAHKGRWTDAIAAYRAADLIYDELRKREPKNDTYLNSQIASRIEMADCHAAAEQWPDAVRTLQLALDGLREVASLRPLFAAEEDRRRGASEKMAQWVGRVASHR